MKKKKKEAEVNFHDVLSFNVDMDYDQREDGWRGSFFWWGPK